MARICTSSSDRVDLGSGNLFSGATGSGTLSSWLRPVTAHASESAVLGIGGNAATNAAIWIVGVGATELVEVQCRATNGGTNNFITSNGALTLNAWNHVLVESSGSAWSVWINGASQSVTVGAGSNSGEWIGDCSPAAGTKTVLLNVFYNGTNAIGCINMDVAEVGLWNGVQLDAGEIAALAAGYAPAMIRPASLSAYWDLRRTVFDWKAYRSGQTITGTSVTPHPRIRAPYARIVPSLTASPQPLGYHPRSLPAPLLAQ